MCYDENSNENGHSVILSNRLPTFVTLIGNYKPIKEIKRTKDRKIPTFVRFIGNHKSV